jgi:hypothetical protein
MMDLQQATSKYTSFATAGGNVMKTVQDLMKDTAKNIR